MAATPATAKAIPPYICLHRMSKSKHHDTKDNGAPLWICEEQEWPVSEEQYATDSTIEL